MPDTCVRHLDEKLDRGSTVGSRWAVRVEARGSSGFRTVGIGPIIAIVALLCVAAAPGADLQEYETDYYLLHTDLDELGVREAVLRTNVLFETYLHELSGFSGRIREKFPIFIFTNKTEYAKATGAPNSAGLYTGRALYVQSDNRANDRTWHIVQHEAFHQFAHRVIGGRLPVWANEGLAEYFGFAVFTGDSYVTGIMSDDRFDEVRYKLRGKRYKSIEEMFNLDMRDWWTDMQLRKQSRRNYDQAWSFVYFLLHGNDGVYHERFVNCLVAVGQGESWNKVWAEQFGQDTGALEEAWREYWLGMKENPSKAANLEAMTRTFLNLLSRAAQENHRFKSARDFFTSAQAGTIEQPETGWLPPLLAKERVAEATRLGKWKLRMSSREVELTCRTRDGLEARGSSEIDDGAITDFEVTVEER
ncbi:MAG: DUF1570 domain-containing protein [Phycisphaerae bacterium]|nr:DUF1570 domain-containing protein [Phycisphaerae bacterium]